MNNMNKAIENTLTFLPILVYWTLVITILFIFFTILGTFTSRFIPEWNLGFKTLISAAVIVGGFGTVGLFSIAIIARNDWKKEIHFKRDTQFLNQLCESYIKLNRAIILLTKQFGRYKSLKFVTATTPLSAETLQGLRSSFVELKTDIDIKNSKFKEDLTIYQTISLGKNKDIISSEILRDTKNVIKQLSVHVETILTHGEINEETNPSIKSIYDKQIDLKTTILRVLEEKEKRT